VPGELSSVMGYQSLYLKYRPQVFDDVVGQDHVCQTLRNALAQGKVAHAYLFCGPRGTGKTTTARILAKALCCANADGPTPDPCGVCDACTGIRDGSLLDVVELDAASNRGIDEVRNLKEIIGFPPSWTRCKVFIIDEVHQMTREAFNALLKTLEEPPDHAFFILATTDPQKVPITILSRCQRFDFRRVGLRDMAGLLGRISEKESIEAPQPALLAISRLADGCVRDAITALDQVAAYSGGRVTVDAVNEIAGAPSADLLFELCGVLARREAAEVFSFVERITQEGKSYGQVLESLLMHLRNLLVTRLGAGTEETLECDAATVELYREQAALFDNPQLAEAIRQVSRALDELRWNGQHRIVTEVTLATIAVGAVAPAAAAAPPPARPPAPKPAAAPKAPPAPARAPEPTPEPPEAAEAYDEPEPEPEPPASDEPSEPPSAPAASTEWQRAVLAISQARPSLAAALRESRADAAGQRLLVQFASRSHLGFFERALADPDAQPAILEAVRQAFGRDLQVAAQLQGDADAAREKRPAERSLLEETLDLFPGSGVADGDG
jgi:DNA polymerase III subunit gamma/tau